LARRRTARINFRHRQQRLDGIGTHREYVI
jgi:hypothetical protein